MIARRLDRAYRAILLAAVIAACVCIGALTLGITIDVILRNTLGSSIPGILDAADFIVFLTAFLGAPRVLAQNEHVRVDVVVESLSPAKRRYVEALANLCGLIVCGTLIVYAVSLGRVAYVDGARIIRSFIFPEWYIYVVVVFSAVLMFIEFSRRLWRAFSGGAGAGGAGVPDAAPTPGF